MLCDRPLLGTYLANLFKSQRRLEAENLFLRHQLNIALRRQPQRLRLRGSDRALLVWMTRPVAEPARSGPGRRTGHDPAVASGGVSRPGITNTCRTRGLSRLPRGTLMRNG